MQNISMNWLVWLIHKLLHKGELFIHDQTSSTCANLHHLLERKVTAVLDLQMPVDVATCKF